MIWWVVGGFDGTLSSTDQSTVMIIMVTAIGMNTITVVMASGDMMIGECWGRNGYGRIWWRGGSWMGSHLKFRFERRGPPRHHDDGVFRRGDYESRHRSPPHRSEPQERPRLQLQV